MITTRIVPLLVALGVGLAVAGCGAGRAEDPAVAVAKAKGALAKVRTARVSFQGSFSSVSGSAGVTVAGTSKRRFGGEALADTTYTLYRASSGTAGPGQNLPDLHTILAGDTYYRRGIGIAGDTTLPPERPWLKSSLPAGERVPVTESSVTSAPEATFLDPQVYIDVVASDRRPIDAGHDEEIGGASTAEYEVSCDFSSHCELDALGRLGKVFPQTQNLRIRLWVDDQFTPRKLTVDGLLENRTLPLQLQGFQLKLTLTLTGLGEPVRIAAPSAAQVYDPCKDRDVLRTAAPAFIAACRGKVVPPGGGRKPPKVPAPPPGG